jgi:predicted nucleic acid-binding protein
MIVADANLILRGIRSHLGASGYVLTEMLKGNIEFALSTAILLEYADVLGRPGLLGNPPVATAGQVEVILDALCARAVLISPWFRFRPFLDDPKDDIYVECALAAGAHYILTDDKHFRHPSIAGFGLKPLSARQFILIGRHQGEEP